MRVCSARGPCPGVVQVGWGDDPALAGAREERGRQDRDQHQQAAFRQVEIGDQFIDHAELEPGADENRRFPLKWLKAPRTLGRAFQRTQRGGAHGYHVSSRRFGGVDCGGCFL